VHTLLVVATLSVLGLSSLPAPSLATAAGADAAAAGSPPVTPAGALVPASGSLFGIASPTWPEREAALHRKFDILHLYHQWGDQFPSPDDKLAAAGRIPLISWRSIPTSNVNSGVADQLIANRARDVKAFGRPLFLEWFWEMDAPHRLVNAESPAAFIAAWKRIHTIFANNGATNVVWVWCPTALGFNTGKAPAWYPGDANVDWVCADGFNWAPVRPKDPWRNFATIFTTASNFATAHHKPLMVGETGVLERKPGEKAAWIANVHDVLKSRFTNVKAIVWFDVKHTALSTGDQQYDFRVDTSPSAFSAFRAMAADLFFNSRR